jgi:hypothetical protein
MNADGSNIRRLTTTSADSQPAWSPDGSRIAFLSFRDDANFDGDGTLTASIYVMNADGTNQVRITVPDSASTDTWPAWSPDSQRLAFVRYGFGGIGLNDGYGELYVVNADGTGLTQLTVMTSVTDANPTHDFPNWSPDGQHIIFSGTGYLPNGPFSSLIWMLNADGSGLHPITWNFDDEYVDPVWSPDGQHIAFVCQPGHGGDPADLCVMNADGTGITRITDTGGVFAPDWQPIAATSNDLIVADCNDPRLAQVTTIPGNLIVTNVAGCSALDLASLTSVGGNLVIADNADLVTVNLSSLVTVGGNVNIDGNGPGGTVDLSSLVTANGEINISGSAVDSINLASLVTASGDINVSGGTVGSINLASLVTASGDINVNGDSIGSVDLSSAATVTGSLELTNVGGDAINLNTTVVGSLTLTTAEATTVSANTPGGTADVTMLGGPASMRVILPQDTFDTPVAFTITKLGDAPPEPGTDASGTAAQLDPLAAYRFDFAIPTLNADAQLAFRVTLSLLDEATRTALLEGVQAGAATIGVKGDAPDATYQAFATCAAGQTPSPGGCIEVTLLASDGQAAADPADAAFVNFAGLAGHFSTWAVVLVAHDAAPPSVTIALSAPNGGVPDGAGEWFISGPVSGSVTADETGAGGSAIVSISCGPITLNTSGLGTTTAAGTFAISIEGTTQISCTGTDSAGNTSAAVVKTVMLDTHPPALVPVVGPAPILLNGTGTAAANASDAVSGVASQGCGALDTSTVGPHTVACTATDRAGNQVTAYVPYTVVYAGGACLDAPGRQVLPPISADGSSVFKQGRTVPVKFRVCDANGAPVGSGDVVSAFRLVQTITGTLSTPVSESVDATSNDGAFRWDAVDQQWIFNLSTRALAADATYVYDITLADGTRVGFRFGLR